MKAIIRTSRITPKKANLIAGMIRNRKANEGLEILKYTPKKAAKILYKLLNSAVNNAVSNFKQDQKALLIKEVVVTKGPTLKRGVPVSRGRVYPILKRTAHITVTLELDPNAAKASKSSKKEETAAASEAQPTKKTAAKPKKTSKK
jgi:large subunit ribosomal protein L22